MWIQKIKKKGENLQSTTTHRKGVWLVKSNSEKNIIFSEFWLSRDN